MPSRRGKRKPFAPPPASSSTASTRVPRSHLPPESIPDTDVDRGSRTEMSDATHRLWYYIGGQRSFSSVFVSPNELIDDLRNDIYNEVPKSFVGRASDLILTKVRYIMMSMNTDVINGLSAGLLHP